MRKLHAAPGVSAAIHLAGRWRRQWRQLLYAWDLHPQFNAIAREALRRHAPHCAAATVGFLDTYPMSILRPDAHAASIAGTKDCLHFSLPGVPDWWSHLLLTTLEAVAEEEGTGSAGRGRRGRRGQW